MGEFIEGPKRRQQQDQMDGKGTICLLEGKPFSSWNPERPPYLQCLWCTGLECSTICPGSYIFCHTFDDTFENEYFSSIVIGINCRTGCLNLNKDISNQMYQTSALIGEYTSPDLMFYRFSDGLKLADSILNICFLLSTIHIDTRSTLKGGHGLSVRNTFLLVILLHWWWSLVTTISSWEVCNPCTTTGLLRTTTSADPLSLLWTGATAISRRQSSLGWCLWFTSDDEFLNRLVSNV